MALKAAAVFAVIMAIVLSRRRAFHPFASFGAANLVTTTRALLVSMLAGFIGEPHAPSLAVAASAIGAIATALDGVDGWLARRSRMTSAFGARFDMEVDALLIQVLSILAWRYGKTGPWILASGLLRYGFAAAGLVWPWMRQPLVPTLRGKAICVLQIAALIVVLLPIVTPPASGLIAAAALITLGYSFLVDTLRLWEQRPGAAGSDIAWRRWIAVAAAFALLDASLTFENVWPTPAVTWAGGVSIELAGCLLLMALAARLFNGLSGRTIGWLSAVWILLVLGRYLEVTAPALYGRDINLYWDLRFIPDVIAMVTKVAPVWLMALAVATVALVLTLLHSLLRRSFSQVNDAMTHPGARRTLVTVASLSMLLFVGERVVARPPEQRIAPAPVLYTYAHQIALVTEARNGSKSLPPSPVIDSTFALVQDADVFLVFVESYGAVSDQPPFASRLARARRQLERDISQTDRRVASAYVESPTFGGSSWLAHLSLISGIEVRDPDTNALLMTQPRDTLVKAFARRGFRTIGLMPGLRQQWPEGRFYGFDEIYGARQLGYTGPEFGWFAVPDQFSLARFDDLEAGKPRQSRFVFFPTISTHFPFSPTPPYQPDWARMLTRRPYDGPDIVRAYARQPNWTDFGPGYVDALSYDFAVLGGYLRRHPERDMVMILIGDHQPAAAVSGERATWNVPVHVITSRTAILDRLQRAGFHSGLEPPGRALTRMHALLPILLSGFSG